MLASQNRFQGRGSLRFVYNRGQTLRSPLLSLKYIDNPRRRQWRAAVVVSRKVHKSAVVRNRIRRRIYEIIKQESSKIQKPYDIVITVFSEELANLEYEKLQKLLAGLLKKAGITTS